MMHDDHQCLATDGDISVFNMHGRKPWHDKTPTLDVWSAVGVVAIMPLIKQNQWALNGTHVHHMIH